MILLGASAEAWFFAAVKTVCNVEIGRIYSHPLRRLPLFPIRAELPHPMLPMVRGRNEDAPFGSRTHRFWDFALLEYSGARKVFAEALASHF